MSEAGGHAGMPWLGPASLLQAQRIVASHLHFTGRALLPSAEPLALAQALFAAPFVVVSHRTEDDPVLNYGNAAALALWDTSWEELTAEAPERSERERLLAAVARDGFIDDYAGVRISRSGRRFRIRQATVWNLLDARGERCGQAATFAGWEFL